MGWTEVLSLAWGVLSSVQPGRLLESLIFLAVLLWRIKPFFNKVEQRLAGVEKAVVEGFKEGSQRFLQIETENKEIRERLTVLEGGKNGN